MATISMISSDTACCEIELTATVESYLKAIFTLTSEGESASTSMIAAKLSVTPPTVSAMLHRLRDTDLVAQTTWGHVELTEHGRRHAEDVVRRHRLLETFLHEVLHVGWDAVHEEAERLEHHLSSRLETLIDAALGFPERDPHGDPIPRPNLHHREHAETPLADASAGDTFLVQRVFDVDPGALRHLADLDIRPGVQIQVEERVSEVAPMWVRVGEHRCSLSSALVNLIHGQVQTQEVA